MKNTPEKIYLHIGFDPSPEDDFKELKQVTWNNKQVSDTDIPYIREPENGGWINVETPPTEKDANRFGKVLVCYNDGSMNAVIWQFVGKTFLHHMWQPLPQPPFK